METKGIHLAFSSLISAMVQKCNCTVTLIWHLVYWPDSSSTKNNSTHSIPKCRLCIFYMIKEFTVIQHYSDFILPNNLLSILRGSHKTWIRCIRQIISSAIQDAKSSLTDDSCTVRSTHFSSSVYELWQLEHRHTHTCTLGLGPVIKS